MSSLRDKLKGAFLGIVRFLCQPFRRWRKSHWAVMALWDGHGKIRNKRCPCGSGLKFKRCHGATKQQRTWWEIQREHHRDSFRFQLAIRFLREKYGG